MNCVDCGRRIPAVLAFAGQRCNDCADEYGTCRAEDFDDERAMMGLKDAYVEAALAATTGCKCCGANLSREGHTRWCENAPDPYAAYDTNGGGE